MPEKPDRKPDPSLQNDVFVKEVRRLVFGVKYTEEKPVVQTAAMGPIPPEEGAGTFYTFHFEERQAVVEWRAKEGFCVTPKREKKFGADSNSVVMNPFIAAARVAKLISGGEMMGISE